MKPGEHQSLWPLVISAGLGAMLLGLSAKQLIPSLIGGILLFAAIAGWIMEGLSEKFRAGDEAGERWPFTDTERVKLGMWIFLAGELIFFGAIFSSYVLLRLKAPSWPAPGDVLNITQGTVNTLILLSSSFTLVLGLDWMRRGEIEKSRNGLALTFLLGLGFIVSKLSEWRELIGHGVTPQSGLHGSTYYFTTGIHGLHVFAGLIVLVYLVFKTQRKGYSEKNYSSIENFGLYWHFVDIIWVIIFPLFYLIS